MEVTHNMLEMINTLLGVAYRTHVLYFARRRIKFTKSSVELRALMRFNDHITLEDMTRRRRSALRDITNIPRVRLILANINTHSTVCVCVYLSATSCRAH